MVLAACSGLVPPPPASSPAHLRPDQAPSAGPIPKVVERAPFLPPPVAAPPTEKYTVVVHEVPVKELLFALARDAAVNVDVDPGIDGIVTLNAIDQALPQILDRIARQVDMRYEIRDKNILVMPDRPYFRSYTIDYVNLSRDTTGTINVATQIATTGAAEIGEGGVAAGAVPETTTRRPPSPTPRTTASGSRSPATSRRWWARPRAAVPRTFP
ncbi:MAG: hypothetical protein ACREWE_09370 [Gammaproteobacteria bacterium]